MISNRMVCVSGEAKEEWPANLVVAQFIVRASNKSKQHAMQEARNTMSDFAKQVRQILTPQDRLVVNQVKTQEKWVSNPKTNEERRDSYTTSITASLTMTRLESKRKKVQNPFEEILGQIFSIAETTGVEPQGMSWQLTPCVELEIETRLLSDAALSAKSRATALAKGAGTKIGSVIAINPPSVPEGFHESARKLSESDQERQDWQEVFDGEVPLVSVQVYATVYFELL